MPPRAPRNDLLKAMLKGQNVAAGGFGFGKSPAIIPAYDPHAQLFFDRSNVVPILARRKQISDQFISAKSLWFWADSECMWFHAAHDEQAGRLDWRNRFSDGRYNCLNVNAAAFTLDKGFFPNGSSSYLNTQYNPYTAESPIFSRYNGLLGVRSNTNNIGTGSLAGFYDGANQRGTTINPKVDSTNNQAVFRVQQGAIPSTSPVNTSMSSIGLFVSSRTTSTDIKGYRQGQLIIASTLAATLIADGAFRLGSINATSFRACEFSFGIVARGAANDNEALQLPNNGTSRRTLVSMDYRA